jgi:Tol biopolymer transport system component
MKATVFSASVRLLLCLAFLVGLAPLGQLSVQASANTLTGPIAYIVPNQADGDEIHLIEPDGTGDRVLFRTNNPLQENFADIMSLAWKPDASELAFASGHEYLCSLYNMDIYAIRANGEDYRRVTDPPTCGARAGLPTGTVIVPVFNANTYSGPFFIYFEGAPSAQAISLASGSTKMVTFENVADYGDVEQSAVYITKDGRYTYAGAHLNVIPGETLTTNTVNMATGVEHFGWYWPSYLHDGSKISTIFTGHDVFTFDSNNREPGFHGDEKLNFKFHMSGTELSWGPTTELANKFLYWGDWQDSSYYMHGSIFLGDITNGSKQMLVDADPNQDGNILLGYSWLPDGSGFLYSHKQMIINWEPNFSLYEVSNIWEYSFATGKSKRISDVPGYTWIHQLSVSPDGSKIVYEYQPSGDWINRTPLELWIMDRDGSNPHRLVTNGRNPAWSPAAIPAVKPVPVLNSLTPASVTAGGAAFPLTVTGSSFVQDSVVRWNGTDLATTYVSATRLTAQVPANKIAATGKADVTVYNPSPSGGTSAALVFSVFQSLRSVFIPSARR